MLSFSLLRGALALCLSTATLALLPTAPALAQAAASAAAEPDTSVLSDTLTYDDIAKQTIYKGNIILTRGAMTLMADQLAIEQDAEGFQHGTATVSEHARVTIRPASQRPDLTPVFSFNSQGVYVGNAQKGSVDSISRWRGLLEKMRKEGFVP